MHSQFDTIIIKQLFKFKINKVNAKYAQPDKRSNTLYMYVRVCMHINNGQLVLTVGHPANLPICLPTTNKSDYCSSIRRNDHKVSRQIRKELSRNSRAVLSLTVVIASATARQSRKQISEELAIIGLIQIGCRIFVNKM